MVNRKKSKALSLVLTGVLMLQLISPVWGEDRSGNDHPDTFALVETAESTQAGENLDIRAEDAAVTAGEEVLSGNPNNEQGQDAAALEAVSDENTAGNTKEAELQSKDSLVMQGSRTGAEGAAGNGGNEKDSETETESERADAGVGAVDAETEESHNEESDAETDIKTGIETEPGMETEPGTESESETEFLWETESETETEADWRSRMRESGISLDEQGLAGLDFSTKRLLLAASGEQILDPENILSAYGDLHLLQYESEDDTRTAYAYYAGAAERGMIVFVDIDSVVYIAGENIQTDEYSMGSSALNEEENPIEQLEEALQAAAPVSGPVVALIDTGAGADDCVVEQVSMIGDDPSDHNGHGTAMLQVMKEINPEIQVVSIKAMDAGGIGNISSVYAAIRYAIEKNVKIINLSLYAYATTSNAVIREAVEEAVSHGIIVVGASGNDGNDVRYYVPGNISAALIVGACDDHGIRLSNSNYGDTVDIHAAADSTSQAAAKISGYLSLDPAMAGSLRGRNDGMIFDPDYAEWEAVTEAETEDETQRETEQDEAENADDEQEDDDREEGEWKIAGYPANGERVSLTEYIWEGDTEFSPDSYDPFSDDENVTAEYIGIDSLLENVYLYRFTLKDTEGYGWNYEVSFATVSDRMNATAGSEMLEKKMPAYINQNRNAGFGGTVPGRIGEIVPGKEYTVFLDDDTFAPENVLLDYNPDTFKVNRVDTGEFDIHRVGEYTVNYEVSYFMDPHCSWIVSSTIRVVDRNLGTAYLQIKEPTLTAKNLNTGKRFGYGEIEAVDEQNALFEVTCLTGGFSLSVEGIADEDYSVEGTDEAKVLTIHAEGLLENSGIVLTRSHYAGGKSFTAGGWIQADASEEMRLSDMSDDAFRVYEQKILTEGFDASAFKTAKQFSGVATGGAKTGNNYFPTGTSPETNYATVTMTLQERRKIAEWANKQNGISGITASDISSFGINCANPGMYGWTPGAKYNVSINASIKTIGSQKYLFLTCSHSIGSGYQSFSGSEYIKGDAAGTLVIKKRIGFSSGTIASSEAVGSLKTTFAIYSDRSCAPSSLVTTIRIENDDEDELGTERGVVQLAPGRYYIKESRQITGTAVNKDIYYADVKAGERCYLSVLSDYARDVLGKSDQEDNWDGTEGTKSFVIRNNPFMFKGIIAAKYQDVKHTQPLAGAIFKVDYFYNFYCTSDSYCATWYFVSDSKGLVTYDATHLASGYTSSALFTSSQLGYTMLPQGGITIQEVSAPKGYTLSDTSVHKYALYPQPDAEGDNSDFVNVKLVDFGNLKKSITPTFVNLPDKGFLQIYKYSDSSCTQENSLYDLEGAQFGIYTDKALKNQIQTLTITENGYSEVSDELRSGTYYVQELAEHTGVNYAWNDKIYTVNVTTKHTKQQPLIVKVPNTPYYDPIGLILQKVDAEGKAVTGVKEAAAPVGAEFTVEYYDGFYDSIQKLEEEKKEDPELRPLRTWILTTKEVRGQYIARLADARGDELYKDREGAVILPLGTIVITETKAAPNYTLDGAVYRNEEGEYSEWPYLVQIRADNGEVLVKGRNQLDGTTAVVSNYQIRMHSVAMDTALQSHYTGAEDVRTIEDTVSIEHTSPGVSYILAGEIVDADTGRIVDTALSETFSGASDFGGATEQTIRFEGKNTDFGEYAGRTLVINEYLFSEEEKAYIYCDASDPLQGIGKDHAIAYHTISNMTEDEKKSQSIYVPSMSTMALSGNSNDKSLPANDAAEIIDRVFYKNLEPGSSYRLEGTIMEAVTDAEGTVTAVELRTSDGKQITAETEFTVSDSNGMASCSFALDTSEMKGKTLVIYEKLYRITGQENAKEKVLLMDHSDPSDQNQMVYIPDVQTEAKDVRDTDAQSEAKGAGNTHHAFSSDENQQGRRKEDRIVKIRDKIRFDNAVPGYEYQVFGTVITREDGTAVPSRVVSVEAGENTVLSREYTDSDADGVIDPDITAAGDAVYTFTAKASSGCLYMTFAYDASLLAGKTQVIFEDMLHNGHEVVVHHDLQSASQTIYTPYIRTEAMAEDTGDRNTGTNDHKLGKEETYVKDIVSYKGVEPGRTYYLKGSMIDKATGEKIDAQMVDEKGNTVSYISFTANGKENGRNADGTCSGNVAVRFRVLAKELENRTLTVFEELYLDSAEGKMVAEHKDINDLSQTVFIPEITTSLAESKTKTNHVLAEEEAVVEDTLHYRNLVAGNTYTVTGTLHRQSDGSEVESVMIDEKGNEIDEYVLTIPEDAVVNETGGVDGTAVIRMRFNAKALEGTTIVAFETVSHNKVPVAVHADLEDDKQTVYIPKLRTMASDDITGTHVTASEKERSITDVVSLEGLKVGQTYRMRGEIVKRTIQEDGTVFVEKVPSHMMAAGDENWRAPGASLPKNDKVDYIEFVPTETSGTISIHYLIDTSVLSGSDLIVYEYLTVVVPETDKEGNETGTVREEMAGKHEDPEDDAQLICVPAIGTSASASDTGTQETQVSDRTKITDTVRYTNLFPGVTYRMTGTLYLLSSGKPLSDAEGNAITQSVTFVPKSSSGSVEIDFELDSRQMSGDSVVVFEECAVMAVQTEDDGKEVVSERTVAVHKNIDDKNQTVSFVNISTAAADKVSGTHEADATSEAVIIDRIYYTGLKTGRKYTVRGTLFDKTKGRILKINGKAVTAEASFTPEKTEGYVDVTFRYNAEKLAGRSLVVFEKLYDAKGVLIAKHEDADDREQTVRVIRIRTKLRENSSGKQSAANTDTADNAADNAANTAAVLTDTVSYVGLTPGDGYTLRGRLMDKESGTTVSEAEEVTFIAKKANGTVTVDFTLDVSKYRGKSLVAFERLYDAEGKLIAKHEDISDQDQTVEIPDSETGKIKSNNPATGDDQNISLFMIMALLAGAAAAVLSGRRKRSR